MKKRILDVLIGLAVGGILGCASFFVVGFIDTYLVRVGDFMYIPMAPIIGGMAGSLYFFMKGKKFSSLGAIVGGPIIGFICLLILLTIACSTGTQCDF